MRSVKRNPEESLDHLLNRFRQELWAAGTIQEIKSHEYYESASQKRKQKKIKNAMKRKHRKDFYKRIEKQREDGKRGTL